MDELCIMKWDTIANFDKNNSEIRFNSVQYWQNATYPKKLPNLKY